MKDKHLYTRVSPEIYSKMLRKCANRGITPYEYLRELVNNHLGTGEPLKPSTKRERQAPTKKRKPRLYATPRTKEEQLLYIQNPEYLKILKYLNEKKD